VCTLIVKWDPGSRQPLLVGANRDENPKRSSEPFAFRQGGILCPLDVRKGTWIGVNQQGVFAALTNLDCENPNRGRASRGLLVLECLHQSDALDAVQSIIRMLTAGIYNAFNLLVADNRHMLAVIGYGSSRRIEIRHFDPGLHVATGWGVDCWDEPRESLIKKELESGTILGEILQLHGDGTERSAVCVHNSDSHVTVSSCIIDVRSGPNEVRVKHKENSPCQVEPWQSVRMVL
jgi:hypothetical protein